MITFQVEKFKDILDEIKSLNAIHYDEVGEFSKNILFDPAWNLYQKLEDNNALFITTVRDKDILIGYMFFIVHYHPHHKNNNIADNELTFIKPEYRKGLLGYKFIKFSIKKLKQIEYIDIISLTSNVNKDLTGIADRLGFKLTYQTFLLEV